MTSLIYGFSAILSALFDFQYFILNSDPVNLPAIVKADVYLYMRIISASEYLGAVVT